MSKKLSVYEDPSVPGALGGVQPYAKAIGATTTQAEKLLQDKLSYTLHKPRRKTFSTLPTLVFAVDEQWQMDLADMQKLSKYNQGNKFILTVIDVLSKYAWAEPLKNNIPMHVIYGTSGPRIEK